MATLETYLIKFTIYFRNALCCACTNNIMFLSILIGKLAKFAFCAVGAQLHTKKAAIDWTTWAREVKIRRYRGRHKQTSRQPVRQSVKQTYETNALLGDVCVFVVDYEHANSNKFGVLKIYRFSLSLWI